MTQFFFPPRHVTLLGLGAMALLVTGCQEPRAPRTPLYAVDFTGGAKTCTTSAVDLTGGKSADATMTLGNDSGWCAITVWQARAAQPGGLLGRSGTVGHKPFAAGLVQARPQHGNLHIHSVGDDTRVDYTPDPGFTGTDRFAVRFLPGNQASGEPVLTVSVTVTAK